MPRLRAIEIDLEDEERAPDTPLGRLEHDLGRALVADGLVTRGELEEARAHQKRRGGRLSTCLWELGLVEEDRLRTLCARSLRVPSVVPADVAEAPGEVLGLVEREVAAKYQLIPFARFGDTLLVATAEPWRLPLLDSIGERVGCRAEPRFLDEAPLARLLGKLLGLRVEERFRREPEPRQRAAPRAARAADDADDGPFGTSAELMLESAFESLYQGEYTLPPAAHEPASPEPPTSTPAPASPPAEAKPAAGADPGPEVLDLTVSVDDWSQRPRHAGQAAPLEELARARESLAVAGDREQLGWALARYGLSKARRVVLLVRRSDLWMGWTGAGQGVEAERVEALMIPPQEGTIFGLVEASGAQYVGPLAPHPVHDRFLGVLGGGEPPRAVGFFPVRHRGRVILGIYLDGGPGGAPAADLADVLLLANEVPAVLERLALAKKRGG